MQLGERRFSRYLAAVCGLGLLAAAFVGSEFRPGVLFGSSAADRASEFLRAWWPPRLDAPFLFRILKGAVDTVAIALVGMACAVVVGLPLGVLGSRIVTHGALFAEGEARAGRAGRAICLAGRLAGAFFRSIPELIWAIVFVRILGLGPAPAIAALAVAYGGMLGKVFSEQLEEARTAPAAALEAVGAGRFTTFVWGVFPQVAGRMASYTAYRFECAVRASALMGFVGAGGLGFAIEVSVQDYLWSEVVTEVALLVFVVMLIETASDGVRGWIG